MNILEKVMINESEQWLLVRGKDSNDPLILQVQAGPGFPMISEANQLQRLHYLEDDFLVAYWDQRGIGKSFHKNEDSKKINLDQLADDVISCTRHLMNKYQKDKVILVGYSLGATLSLFASQKTPELFSMIFAVGVDIDLPTANNSAMDFVIDKVTKQNKNKSLRQANQLKGIEINNAKLFQKRAKLLSNTGGVIVNKNYNAIFFSTIRNMLLTKEYTLSDIVKTSRGIKFCQNAFLPEMNTINLFETIKNIDVPVHFFQGVKDAIAPYEIAIKYFDFVNCRSKSFTEFQYSAHMPHLEEPVKFAETVRAKINDRQIAGVGISNRRLSMAS